MKKILKIITATILGLLLFTACKKEELVVVNEPLELDENSPKYQEYMIERAINLIELFRFDKLGNTIDRIKDPAKKAEILAMLDEYRTRAKNEAWYYVTPENDTLYFFPPVEGSRLEAKNSHINFTPLFIQFPWQKQIVNVRGMLHGMGIFPNLEQFGVGNCLATGVKDMDQLPELKLFSWTFMIEFLQYFYPDLVFETIPLQVDLSKNSKLERIDVDHIDISDIQFPGHKLTDYFGLTDGIFDNNLSNINANKIVVRTSAAADPEVTLSNSVGQLELTDISGIKKLDLSNIKDLELITLASRTIEELTLPDGITDEILENSRSIASWAEPLRLKQGCIIHNAPEGIERHVQYYQ
ncbi:MAG: hypothetical protein KF862_14885 [Chitinophagaceae bacterium]|nr:hypothetical protein [Chitinophagaceae bacterium]